MSVVTDDAISTRRLTKRYGRRRGLDELDLDVGTGEVFGYLGPNGAGKTTTIRLLLDLIRPSCGSVVVLGLDPRRQGVALRRRLGYLPGDFTVDTRQPVRELLTYLGNLRGGVPRGRVEALAERLDLDLDARIRSLSKGNRQKVGLVQAFMHKPDLLILDEPTSGLDPLVQQRFLAMVREAKAAGQTVFLSSHVLSEVQQSADRVGIVRSGRLVAVEEVETLRRRALRRVEIRFDAPVPAETFTSLPGVRDVQVDGSVLRCRLAGPADPLLKAAARFTALSVLAEEPDLEELFLTYYAEEDGRAA
jgi:ABC-2 type transport system ATP-binding protein